MPPWAASSPGLMPSGQAHLHLCLQNQLYCATSQGVEACSSKGCSLLAAVPAFSLLSHLYHVPRETCRKCSTATGGQGQLSWLPHMARGEIGRASPPCPLYFYQMRDGASSPAPPPPELALLCCPLKVQGLLSHVLQLVRSRAISLCPVSRGNMRHRPLPLNSHRCRHPLHICTL